MSVVRDHSKTEEFIQELLEIICEAHPSLLPPPGCSSEFELTYTEFGESEGELLLEFVSEADPTERVEVRFSLTFLSEVPPLPGNAEGWPMSLSAAGFDIDLTGTHQA